MSFLQGIAAALTPLGLLWTILIIGIATFLHELAHYALARWQGVAVKSFSIGMGPVLGRRAWRGTEWRLSLLPIGGYVEIDGMAPTEDPDGTYRQPTRGFAGLPAWGKVAVLLAGPLMNLLVAICLLTFYGSTIPVETRTIISVSNQSKAQILGFRTGDAIIAINGQNVANSIMSTNKVLGGWNTITSSLKTDGSYTFTVLREGTKKDISFQWVAKVDEKQQILGVALREFRVYIPKMLGIGFTNAIQTTVESIPQVIRAFGNLFARFFTVNLSQDQGVSGPIGTAEIVSQAVATSPWALLRTAILLNLSLAFFNLIPIPGLDGGRILLVLIGAVRRRPLTLAQEQAINVAGFAFVMLLMVFVVVRDVSRFF
jgi:regulator of sigma E protease